MNSSDPPRGPEPGRNSSDEALDPAVQNPASVDRAPRQAIAGDDEIGVPTGYPERMFSSKRFPVRRPPRDDRPV